MFFHRPGNDQRWSRRASASSDGFHRLALTARPKRDLRDINMTIHHHHKTRSTALRCHVRQTGDGAAGVAFDARRQYWRSPRIQNQKEHLPPSGLTHGLNSPKPMSYAQPSPPISQIYFSPAHQHPLTVPSCRKLIFRCWRNAATCFTPNVRRCFGRPADAIASSVR